MPFFILKTSLSNSPYFHSLKPSHPHTKYHLLILFLPTLRLHPLQVQKAVATTQILDVHQLVHRIPEITQITLKLLFLPHDRDSSPLILLLSNLFSHHPLHHLSWNSIKCLLNIHKTHVKLFLIPVFLLHSLHFKQCICHSSSRHKTELH